MWGFKGFLRFLMRCKRGKSSSPKPNRHPEVRPLLLGLGLLAGLRCHSCWPTSFTGKITSNKHNTSWCFLLFPWCLLIDMKEVTGENVTKQLSTHNTREVSTRSKKNHPVAILAHHCNRGKTVDHLAFRLRETRTSRGLEESEKRGIWGVERWEGPENMKHPKESAKIVGNFVKSCFCWLCGACSGPSLCQLWWLKHNRIQYNSRRTFDSP